MAIDEVIIVGTDDSRFRPTEKQWRCLTVLKKARDNARVNGQVEIPVPGNGRTIRSVLRICNDSSLIVHAVTPFNNVIENLEVLELADFLNFEAAITMVAGKIVSLTFDKTLEDIRSSFGFPGEPSDEELAYAARIISGPSDYDQAPFPALESRYSNLFGRSEHQERYVAWTHLEHVNFHSRVRYYIETLFTMKGLSVPIVSLLLDSVVKREDRNDVRYKWASFKIKATTISYYIIGSDISGQYHRLTGSALTVSESAQDEVIEASYWFVNGVNIAGRHQAAGIQTPILRPYSLFGTPTLDTSAEIIYDQNLRQSFLDQFKELPEDRRYDAAVLEYWKVIVNTGHGYHLAPDILKREWENRLKEAMRNVERHGESQRKQIQTVT